METKKAYICPAMSDQDWIESENLLAASNPQPVLGSGNATHSKGGLDGGNGGDLLGRETVQSQDAWEEW